MGTKKRLMSIADFKRNLCHYCNTYMSDEPCEPGECWVYDVIAQTGSVGAVEVVPGRWLNWKGEPVSPDDYWRLHRCSVCGNEWEFAEALNTDEVGWNYCPNCGAKMDGDGNG